MAPAKRQTTTAASIPVPEASSVLRTERDSCCQRSRMLAAEERLHQIDGGPMSCGQKRRLQMLKPCALLNLNREPRQRTGQHGGGEHERFQRCGVVANEASHDGLE